MISSDSRFILVVALIGAGLVFSLVRGLPAFPSVFGIATVALMFVIGRFGLQAIQQPIGGFLLIFVSICILETICTFEITYGSDRRPDAKRSGNSTEAISLADSQRLTVAMMKHIQEKYPNLKMSLDLSPHEPVDVKLTVPLQDGLPFKFTLYLQKDELFLGCDSLWVSWFPIDDEEITKYIESVVSGLIDGEYRIEETYRFQVFTGGELQYLDKGKWIGAEGNFRPCAAVALILLPLKVKIIQNNHKLKAVSP